MTSAWYDSLVWRIYRCGKRIFPFLDMCGIAALIECLNSITERGSESAVRLTYRKATKALLHLSCTFTHRACNPSTPLPAKQ